MIYSNININEKEVEMDFGKLHQIILGEKGRGRKEIRLTCPAGTMVKEGMNQNITIGLTKSGRPRINAQKDGTIYLLISTEGGYTRRGCGYAEKWKGNTATYELLAEGNGADGLAGRIGYWDVYLLKVVGQPDNDWIRIKLGGGGAAEWLHITRHGIFLLEDMQQALDYCDAQDFDFPATERDGWGDVVLKDGQMERVSG